MITSTGIATTVGVRTTTGSTTMCPSTYVPYGLLIPAEAEDSEYAFDHSQLPGAILSWTSDYAFDRSQLPGAILSWIVFTSPAFLLTKGWRGDL